MRHNGRVSGRARLIIACAATAAVIGPLAYFWQASLLPERYSVTDMGRPDHGSAAGATTHLGHGHPAGMQTTGTRSLTTLIVDPARPADVDVTLTARKQRFRLPTGRNVDGYTLNGQSPGPVIHAVEGQLVQVRLINESVPGGVTLHWHGVDVPEAMDGVAGVTQDAVGTGQQYLYRFVAERAGTFWYHSHQISHEQVTGGLLGALIVTPRQPDPATTDVVALVHLYDGARTLNGHDGDVTASAQPGRPVRVRVINTDNGEMSAWVAGAPFRLVAVDGTDLNAPTPIRDKAVLVTAGGRADLQVTMAADGSAVRVHLGGSVAVVLGSGSYDAPVVARPAATLDLLSYGGRAPLGFDPNQPDRQFQYDIGRRPGFIDGRPGLFWTVNGRMFPDVPMFVVAEGDVVRMHIANNSGEAHPMHLHGNHAVVLSRNGVSASGSPWWVDSLDVGDGENYDIAFVADNPGIWMDHCHNLPHATDGLVAHLMYEGITTPFAIGGTSGNQPE